MLNKNPIWILFCFLFFCKCSIAKQQWGVIAVPVCDSGEVPHLTLSKSKGLYESMPLSGGIKQFISCPRLHQFLFNETVEILQHKENKVQIKAQNSWYNVAHSSDLQNSYWIGSDCLVSFKKLKARSIDPSLIPCAIAFKKENNDDQTVVTLVAPFTDHISKITYSAGTRFKKANQNGCPDDTVTVYALDRKKMIMQKINIPKALIMKPIIGLGQQERINEFVQLLKNWAHQNTGFIPYVWGGSSFTRLVYGNFVEIDAQSNGIQTSFYDYPESPFNQKTGFDCSGLVCRAAQMAGIPYYFKNTSTIAKNLTQLSDENLEEGDIILLLHGASYVHVMVVSSIKDNLFIEAGSYKFGYGRVHEISLKKTFENIRTYKELIKAAKDNELALRMNRKGEIIEANHVKLFKLKSAWRSTEHNLP